jgi:hypothetical protein
MTTYRGPEISVQRSADALKAHLSDFAHFKALFPDSVTYFRVYEEGFTFQLGQLPKVALKRQASDDLNRMILSSAGGTVDFRLIASFRAVEDNACTVYLSVEGDFNPMIRMMLEKPLNQLLSDLSDGLSSI